MNQRRARRGIAFYIVVAALSAGAAALAHVWVRLQVVQLGYEARCAPPHSFDVVLGSQLGLGAFRALDEKGLDGHMVSVSGQLELRYVPYGNVNVRVIRVGTDQSESAAQRGSVALTNDSVYANQFPFGYWIPVSSSTGIASFTVVGGGNLRAEYWDPVTNVKTPATATLAVEGSTLQIDIRALDTSSSMPRAGARLRCRSPWPASGSAVPMASLRVAAAPARHSERAGSARAAAGPRSDFFDLGGDLPSGGAIILRFQRALDGGGQQGGNFLDLGGAFRADVDLGASLTGDGVDAGAAFDDSEVIG